MFRIRLRMTSTVMSPREICIPSVLALLFDDGEQGLDRGFLPEHVVHRALDLLLASQNPTPSVRPFASDGSMLI